VDGKIAIAVPAGKEGPVHDFAWNPKSDGTFVAIVGKSPPMATLHKRDGAPCFSFGAGSFNSCIFQPQGRFLLLGGFGNMSAPAQVWDVNKCRPISAPMTADAATAVCWSACGRYLVTGTTYPRLKVDNGYSIWSYHGEKQYQTKESVLYQVLARPGSFPDRPESPIGSVLAASICKPQSKYVPPHLRGKPAATSVVSELMSADNKPAEKLACKAPTGIVGATPAITESAKRRAKASAKRETAAMHAEAQAALAEICADMPTSAATPEVEEDPAKELKRLHKKVKQIEGLQTLAASGATLNPDQTAKLAAHAECLSRIAELVKLEVE
jgi:translation initiation factor 2A